MNQQYNEKYEALVLYGGSGLVLNPDEEASIEGVRSAIDHSNERAVKEGYNAWQFVIVKKQMIYVHDEEGRFVMSTVVRTRQEIYPEI